MSDGRRSRERRRARTVGGSGPAPALGAARRARPDRREVRLRRGRMRRVYRARRRRAGRARAGSRRRLGGALVTTVEGLAGAGGLHPVQRAFREAGAMQCGFCTPGMIVATVALLAANPDPTRATSGPRSSEHLPLLHVPAHRAAVGRAAELARDGRPPGAPSGPDRIGPSGPRSRSVAPDAPWDLLPPSDRDYFAVLPDGLVVGVPAGGVRSERCGPRPAAPGCTSAATDGSPRSRARSTSAGQPDGPVPAGRRRAPRAARVRGARDGRHRRVSVRHGHVRQPIDAGRGARTPQTAAAARPRSCCWLGRPSAGTSTAGLVASGGAVAERAGERPPLGLRRSAGGRPAGRGRLRRARRLLSRRVDGGRSRGAASRAARTSSPAPSATPPTSRGPACSTARSCVRRASARRSARSTSAAAAPAPA